MKIKLLFNGFRHNHILALYHKAATSDLVEIAGCIETDAAAREAAERSLGIRFSDKSYDQWLTENIDAVAVGNAYGDRAEVIIKALSAGKHVIADKPICTDLAQLETIRQLAQAKGLKIVGMLDYEEGTSEPITVDCPPATRDYLHELADEIRGSTKAARIF